MLELLLVSNEEKISAKAELVRRKIEQFLLDINAASDLGDNATTHKLKMPWTLRTDEGFYRDVEITVQVSEKPHKLLGGTKFASKADDADDGQASFLDGDESDEE